MSGHRLRVAAVTDVLTRACLQPECQLADLTPDNYQKVLVDFKPDFLFFESVWNGYEDSWKRKVASYPWYQFSSNKAVVRLVEFARDLGIPTVFWCKEDGVHFHRFINSARHFDHVLTVDVNFVDRYKEVMGGGASVGVLPFPVQPKFHSFTGFDFKHRKALFLGSYSHHIHDDRRAWQNMVFNAVLKSGLGLTIFDRNSDRKSNTYRYPPLPGAVVSPVIAHPQTGDLYKTYVASLNVNTVANSSSMYSRRLVEILACGGIAVTSPSKSVDALFKDYCHVVNDAEQAQELFRRLAVDGPSADDMERARAGAAYVAKEFTWSKRLEDLAVLLGL